MNTGALDRLQVEGLKQRSERTHRAPWGFGRDERPRCSTQLIISAPTRRDISLQDEALLLRGGPQSLLARHLRAPAVWGARLSEKLRHGGVDLVVFPESHRDWSASLDRLAGLLRG